jgi:hypothetical protein
MINYWIKFIDILDNKGIKKIIPIKSFLLPPYQRNDIDSLVIDRKNYKKIEKILQEQGFKKGRTFYRDRGKRFWRFPGDKGVPAIHLHKICGWAGINYLEPQKIWQRRRKAQIQGYEIDLPSYEDEFLISALHSVFENKAIKKEEFLYLSKLVKEQNLDWKYIREESKNIGCTTALKTFKFYFDRTQGKEDIKFPILIPYKESLKSMMNHLFYDLRYFRFMSFIKDFFSYILDVSLDWLRKK